MFKAIKSCFVFAMILSSLFLIPFYTNADTLGQGKTFFVDSSFDKYSRHQISATLQHISDNLYIYIEDSYWNGLDTSHRNLFTENIAKLSREFDNIIYPTETKFWGSEPNPGIDGDPKITVLLEQLVTDNGGYFNTANGYSKSKISDSNEREMIVLNAEAVNSEASFIKAFLAHEFQHLISFNQKELLNKSTEDIWLNELRSEYSISLVGYNTPYYNSSLNRRALSFLEDPSDSLTEWPNKTADYSIATIFAEYLVEQYGKGILNETLPGSLSGINSINSFLQAKGYYERFNDIFLRWMTAVYLNDPGLDSHYGYVRPELKNIKVKPQQSVSMSSSLSEFTTSHLIKNWQPLWLEYLIDNSYSVLSKSLKIEVTGQSDQNFLASYITYFNDGRVRVDRLLINAGNGVGYVSGLSSGVKKVVLLATNGTKLSQFYTSETPYNLSVKASLVDSNTIKKSLLEDGVLVRKTGEKEIYVIWGKYKRYLVPGVIALYGHLDPASAIEISSDIFNSYITTNYVKYISDERIYAIWPDGTKHWLNITPQQWDASHRDWKAIFTINELELNYYKTGEHIVK